MTSLCKAKYMKIADKEAETRLDKLVRFLEENDYGFYEMGERNEGSQKYVRVTVDIKMTSNNIQRKI